MIAKKKQKKEELPLDRIEEALLRRALGFQQCEEQLEDLVDKKSGEVLETLKRRRVTKEILPDVRALLFWLKNRRPDRWKDRADSENDSSEYEFDEEEKEL